MCSQPDAQQSTFASKETARKTNISGTEQYLMHPGRVQSVYQIEVEIIQVFGSNIGDNGGGYPHSLRYSTQHRSGSERTDFRLGIGEITQIEAPGLLRVK